MVCLVTCCFLNLILVLISGYGRPVQAAFSPLPEAHLSQKSGVRIFDSLPVLAEGKGRAVGMV